MGHVVRGPESKGRRWKRRTLSAPWEVSAVCTFHWRCQNSQTNRYLVHARIPAWKVPWLAIAILICDRHSSCWVSRWELTPNNLQFFRPGREFILFVFEFLSGRINHSFLMPKIGKETNWNNCLFVIMVVCASCDACYAHKLHRVITRDPVFDIYELLSLGFMRLIVSAFHGKDFHGIIYESPWVMY